MKRSCGTFALFAGLLFALLTLQACTDQPFAAPMATNELPTPIPPYVATDQAAAIEARATIQAGQAQAAELAVRASQVALNMTAAAATEEALIRQTQRSEAATATAFQVANQTTATAQAAEQTAIAIQKASTATQAAENNQATGTAIALGILQASATAEVERIANQREAERQTLLFRTWAWRIALVILFAVVVIIVWQTMSWARLHVFGVHRWANRPVMITPNGKGGYTVFDISRSLQPGATISDDGHVQAMGGVDDVQVQSQVAARAQAAELMLAANSGQGVHGTQRRGLMRQALQSGTPPVLPSGDIVQGDVMILPPDDPRIRPLLDEVESKMIEEGVQA